MTATITNSLTVKGGKGGDGGEFEGSPEGGPYASGGDGGDAFLELDFDITVSGKNGDVPLAVRAGDGGNRAESGKGGIADFKSTKSVTTLDNTGDGASLLVKAGHGNSNSGGDAGFQAASVSVGSGGTGAAALEITGGGGGVTGSGGKATFTVDESVTVTNCNDIAAMRVTAGDGAGGREGGNAEVIVGSFDSSGSAGDGSLIIRAGDGINASGGDATFTTTGAVTTGAGGTGSASVLIVGGDRNGGEAKLTADSVTVQNHDSSVTPAMLVQSGKYGTSDQDGAVTVTIENRLNADSWAIAKGDGRISLTIGEISATRDVTATLEQAAGGTTAWSDSTDRLTVKSLRFEGGDMLFNLQDRNAGTANFRGDDNKLYVDSRKQDTHTFDSTSKYDISRGSATFFIAASTQNNDVLLDAKDAPIVVGSLTKISCDFENQAQTRETLNYNGAITLIQNVDGAVTVSPTYFQHGSLIYMEHVFTELANLKFAVAPSDASLVKGHNLSYLARQTLLEEGGNITVELISENRTLLFTQSGELMATTVTSSVSSSGGKNEIKPECSLDLVSFHLNAGVDITRGFGESALFLRPYFEAGWGRYHADDDIYSWALNEKISYRGSGNTRYFGGGLAAMYVLKNGFGVDAVFRAGQVSSNLSSYLGSYNRSSTGYVGGHFGLFKIFELTPKSTLTPYARYMYFRQNSDSVTNHFDEVIDYQGVSSSRLRAGARYTHKFSRRASAFADAGWEYQADGKLESYINGLVAPGLRTNSHYGYLRLGAAWRQCPETGKGWNLSASVAGSLDERKSVSGQINIGFGF